MWAVVQLRGRGTSIAWKHILAKCASMNEAISLARDKSKNMNAREIFIEDLRTGHKVCVLDLLCEAAEEAGADS